MDLLINYLRYCTTINCSHLWAKFTNSQYFTANWESLVIGCDWGLVFLSKNDHIYIYCMSASSNNYGSWIASSDNTSKVSQCMYCFV